MSKRYAPCVAVYVRKGYAGICSVKSARLILGRNVIGIGEEARNGHKEQGGGVLHFIKTLGN